MAINARYYISTLMIATLCICVYMYYIKIKVTKQISITIRVKVISPDGTQKNKYIVYKISYSTSNTIENALKKAISIEYGTKYTLIEMDREPTRTISSFYVIDLLINGLKITVINSDIYNEKMISIPINTKVLCKDGQTKQYMHFRTAVLYSKATAISNVIDNAMETIHEKSNGIKYTVYNTDRGLLRAVTSYDIIDLAFKDLEITLIDSDIYNKKMISIPINTRVLCNAGKTKQYMDFRTAVLYSKTTTISNVIDNAMETIHEKSNEIKYAVCNNDRCLSRAVTSFDIIDLAFKGLEITLIDSDIYDGKNVLIPIKTKVLCNDGKTKQYMDFKTAVLYSEATTISNVIDNAMETIHKKSNGTKYTVYNTDRSLLREVTSYDINDLAFKGLEITLIDSDIYDGKNVLIKLIIHSLDIFNYNTVCFKTKYTKSNTMRKVLKQAMEMINTETSHYIIKGWMKWNEIYDDNLHIDEHWIKFHQRDLTELDSRITEYSLYNIIIKGLHIKIEDFIEIPVHNDWIDNIFVKTPYLLSVNISNIIDKALDIINDRSYPTAYNIDSIVYPKEMKLTEAITNYSHYNLSINGLRISLKNQYRHKINNVDITCKYLKNNNNNDAETDKLLQCPYYKSMKENDKYTNDNYDHLVNFTHFSNRSEQEFCKHGQECQSFKRYQTQKKPPLIDLCHMVLYRHPPRINRQIQMSGYIGFVLNECDEKNEDLYGPKDEKIVEQISSPNVVEESIEVATKTAQVGAIGLGAITATVAGGVGAVAGAIPGATFGALYGLTKPNTTVIESAKHGALITGGLGAAGLGAIGGAVGATVGGAATGLLGAAVMGTSKLASSIGIFITNAAERLINPPDEGDENKYKFNDTDGWINALILEVDQNGYKYDLCLKCKGDELKEKSTWYSSAKCPHDINSKDNYNDTLLCQVDKKLNHARHVGIGEPLRRDHMLAFLLYTGGDCTYALCGAQRSGDYKTWKWFDFCLYEAIKVLSDKETGDYMLYSGLEKVKMKQTKLLNAGFVTYVSTTYLKSVALDFMGEEKQGMLMEIDPNLRSDGELLCCDVSWISKFKDEAEVLIARSVKTKNMISFQVSDDSENMQTVSLSKAKTSN